MNYSPFFNPYQQQNMQPNYQNPGYNIFNNVPPQIHPQTKTNIVLVTSLEDALSRYAEPNSNMLYVDQDKPVIYNITTDAQGRKTHKIMDISEHKQEVQNTSEYVTKADVEEIVKKQLAALNNKEDIE